MIIGHHPDFLVQWDVAIVGDSFSYGPVVLWIGGEPYGLDDGWRTLSSELYLLGGNELQEPALPLGRRHVSAEDLIEGMPAESMICLELASFDQEIMLMLGYDGDSERLFVITRDQPRTMREVRLPRGTVAQTLTLIDPAHADRARVHEPTLVSFVQTLAIQVDRVDATTPRSMCVLWIAAVGFACPGEVEDVLDPLAAAVDGPGVDAQDIGELEQSAAGAVRSLTISELESEALAAAGITIQTARVGDHQLILAEDASGRRSEALVQAGILAHTIASARAHVSNDPSDCR